MYYNRKTSNLIATKYSVYAAAGVRGTVVGGGKDILVTGVVSGGGVSIFADSFSLLDVDGNIAISWTNTAPANVPPETHVDLFTPVFIKGPVTLDAFFNSIPIQWLHVFFRDDQ